MSAQSVCPAAGGNGLLAWCGLLALVLAVEGREQASGQAATSRPLTEDDFIVVSGPAAPRVAYALERGTQRLRVVLDVASFVPDGSDVTTEVGLAALKQ